MFANDALSRHIKWMISDIFTNSDHMAIIADVSFSRETETELETKGVLQIHQTRTPLTWYFQ